MLSACASKPPCGSCRCSSSVVNFRCSVTRRFASPGAQAVTWLHNQCAWRVKHSWVHFFTVSLCVLSRFGSAQHLRSSDVTVKHASFHSTKRPDAMSSGSLRDISLYHEPSDDVNSLLNLKTARHARQKNWRTRESLALRQVPVHQASSGLFMSSCTWATVHLSKNEVQCQRVLQTVHTERSRMIFRTVQSQFQRLQADVLYGIARTSGLDRTPLGEGADYLIRTFHFNCSPHCTAHRFCVMSLWKMSTTSKTRRCLGRSEELLISSRPQSIASSATSPASRSWLEWSIYP